MHTNITAVAEFIGIRLFLVKLNTARVLKGVKLLAA